MSLVLGVLAPLAAGGLAAGEAVTAIDILLLPDETMIDHAQADNARLRANYPAGFALDAEHRPHITLLQRYVRTNDLDKVFAAVQRVFDEQRPVGWELEATGCFFVDFDNMGLAGIVVRPTPQLRVLQQAIVGWVYEETNIILLGRSQRFLVPILNMVVFGLPILVATHQVRQALYLVLAS